jgi:glycosyltransferase involved in cell wall biosynthesis
MADFTIVTPIFNQASTIEACINSVASQGVSVDHIIIDGGSTDGTVDLLQKYEDHLSYWISEPDGGQSEAINKGLAMANGTFFNWLNADDILTENALKTIQKSFGKEPNVVVGKCQHVNNKGDILAEGSAKLWPTLEATLGNYSMGQPSVFYRTSVVRELGGLNECLHLCMDMELWFRYLLKMGISEIDSSSKVLSRFLVREDSKSSTFKKEMDAEKYGLYRALFSSVGLPPVLAVFFNNYSIPPEVKFAVTSNLNIDAVIANFAWHLMVESYESGDLNSYNEWYELVKKGNRLSASDKLTWKARITSKTLLMQWP